jgi:hypothetical protein
MLLKHILTVAEPTGDRTITLPNQNGTVAMDGDAISIWSLFLEDNIKNGKYI